MASLTFALKFSMTFFLLGLHLALFILFAISLAIRSGGNIEAIALGIEAVQLILIPIRLYYYIRFRDRPSRLTHERLFFLCLWLISLSGAIIISVRSPHLLDDFAGLSHPEPAAIAVITLAWLAWTLTVHLIWVVIQEELTALDEEDLPEEPIAWPAYTTPAPRATQNQSRPKRISAKIVAVAHGSDPLLWARKKNGYGKAQEKSKGLKGKGKERERAPAVPTAAYDPRDRRLPPLPQQQQGGSEMRMKTTYDSWYGWDAA
ncbi:hypothetical protein OH77DRAFT_74620 [Trametes cingulata]|nr:hypothetical protein OH77DRAFT_74620 [Trametes cingulata]